MNRTLFFRRGFLLLPFMLPLSSVQAAPPSDGGCTLPDGGKISGQVRLNPSCVYQGSVSIAGSGTSLDCAGATLDGEGRRKFGVIIRSPEGNIKDVKVENCIIKNYANTGIFVTSGKRPNEWSQDIKANYNSAPSNITLKNVSVDNSGRVGVYFDDYVTRSSLRDSKVSGSGGAGIYLDQGSQYITIDNNSIENNGYSKTSKAVREGLAIDASALNSVTRNKFSSNAAGGVFLYKNCGEKFSSGGSTLRWQSSNDNSIKTNSFINEKVGIWVASRQSRNLAKWDCGDAPVDSSRHYFADFANHNTIEDNTFCRNDVAVRVEGDDNIMKNNSFDSGGGVVVPFESKAKPDGKRSIGNVIVKGASNAKCGS